MSPVVLNPETGGLAAPEHRSIQPGADPIAERHGSLDAARATADVARAGKRDAEAATLACARRRVALAQAWADAKSAAERQAVEQQAAENETALRQAESTEAMWSERIASAEEIVVQAKNELAQTYRLHVPDLLREEVANALPAIEQAQQEAAKAVEELHRLTAEFSRRCRPLRAATAEWLDHHERSNNRTRSQAQLASMVNVPRGPLDLSAINALHAFSPLSEAMKLLLAEQAEQREAD